MAEYFSAHPLYAVILCVLALFTFGFCIKAGRAFSERRKENNEIVEKLKADTALRREFDELTPEKVQSAEDGKLFRGVALGLCRRIEKSSDMLSEFNAFTDEQRMIYALHFVFEDGGEKLDGFFRANGSPLTDWALKGAEKTMPEKALDAFRYEYNAFDDSNEETSLIPAEIEKHNAAFLEYVQGAPYAPVADFIRNNIGGFTAEG